MTGSRCLEPVCLDILSVFLLSGLFVSATWVSCSCLEPFCLESGCLWSACLSGTWLPGIGVSRQNAWLLFARVFHRPVGCVDYVGSILKATCYGRHDRMSVLL